jgi:NitT/TauT family transport system substrate-binding protein
MNRPRPQPWHRREFLAALTGAATAGLVGLPPERVAAEPPPETTRLRLARITDLCLGTPQLVAEDLLRTEGFSEIEYVDTGGAPGRFKAVAEGRVDVSVTTGAPIIIRVDAGDPITLLAGLHVGCFELFATERIRSVRDLKGKSVAVTGLGTGRHVFLASIAAYVGLDPRRDLNWVTSPAATSMRLFAEGKIDAFMGFPPEPQELRARKVGHVIVNTSVDRPWSQYFCCMIFAHRDFAQKHPVAAKRALRAFFKAANVCAVEPERAAQLVVDRGLPSRYDQVLQTLKDVPFGRWQDTDAEDTVRFYALRLHEAGLIKSGPQKILAQGTDWRFLNELKKELKG